MRLPNLMRTRLSLAASPRAAGPQPVPPLRKRIIWTVSNLMMLAGLYLLLYVGGLYTQIEYNRLAARGDSDLPAPRIMMERENTPPLQPSDEAMPSVFSVPVISNEGQIAGPPPAPAQVNHQSTVSRIVIPSIKVDSKVVQVGWHEEVQRGQKVAVWEVAEYAVGHHKGTANPGEENNVVLAGHVGGYGKVFKDLYYVKPGDQMTIYSADQQYLYVVQEHLVLNEEGQPPEVRAANARYIEPTDQEVVTLITCWPPKGAQKFKQRVVIRAVPYGSTLDSAPTQDSSSWTIR